MDLDSAPAKNGPIRRVVRLTDKCSRMTKCPIVETSLGKVKGRLLHIQPGGRQVYNYTNLPFAKPPVGELRFEPPCRPSAWAGVLDGSIDPPRPLQDLQEARKTETFINYSREVGVPSEVMSEDCLYLSVYTTNPSTTANLPVLFWIYGGGFNIGCQCIYSGHILSSFNDVVVVVPNYRLNVFGFLSMGKGSVCPGNMGLLDQLMALTWTRDSIRGFGGDPKNVTIFGESMGGMSVNYHLYSPLSQGLFHKAISHSGSIDVPGYPMSCHAVLQELKIQLKITASDPKALLRQLKSCSANDLINAVVNLNAKMLRFKVVDDGNFFIGSVSEFISQREPSPVPYITGCNNTEGYGVMHIPSPPGMEEFNKNFFKKTCISLIKEVVGGFRLIRYASRLHGQKGLPDASFETIVREYEKGEPDNKYKWNRVYGSVLADVVFVIPMIKSAREHSGKKLPTYMYFMSQTLKYSHDPEYGPESSRKPSICECDHGDDTVFTFGLPFLKAKTSIDAKFSEEEKSLSREWMKYLTNFAKHGNPNIGVPVSVTWPTYDELSKEYLSVKFPLCVQKNLSQERFKFWTEVIEPMKNGCS